MKKTDRGHRVALVAPWFGRELIGGAERLAWELSHALVRQNADVDVLTTTCRSFHDDWGADYHRAGTRFENGLTIRRFKVDTRDRAAFTRANAKIMALPRISLKRDSSPLPPRDVHAFFADNINAAALRDYLRDHGRTYDAIVFVPYLYGTTVTGVPLVAERAFLIPCLHDEPYAYLEPIREAMAQARGLLFNSEGEAEVAGMIFGPALYAKASIVGHAVSPVEMPRFPITIGSFAPHRARYVLYLGRQDRSKNVDFLLDAFRAFRRRRVATSLQLVLAGPQPGGSYTGDGITSLGAVAEDAKAALLTYARALAQPSINESFSRAIYESWYAARPVIVHAECRATARAVEESGGGWIGTSVDDWVGIFTQIDEAADAAVDAAGQRGRAAAVDIGSWDDVAARALGAIDQALGRVAAGVTIDQVIPLGERPVAAYAEALGAALQNAGATMSVAVAQTYARHGAARVVVHARGSDVSFAGGDALIAHSGTITLPDGTAPIFASSVRTLTALTERGCRARLLPHVVDPAVWAQVRGHTAVQHLDDGRLTILSLSPLNKRNVEWLIDMFVALIGIMGAVRLLVLDGDCDAEALATLKKERRELDLEDFVTVIGTTIAERYAALRATRVAVAFGQALPEIRVAVDPLWFDVPVVAFDDAIVREAIEPCGLIVDDRRPHTVAAVVKVVARDQELRRTLIAEGRRVRTRYGPHTVALTLLEAVCQPAMLPIFNRTIGL